LELSETARHRKSPRLMLRLRYRKREWTRYRGAARPHFCYVCCCVRLSHPHGICSGRDLLLVSGAWRRCGCGGRSCQGRHVLKGGWSVCVRNRSIGRGRNRLGVCVSDRLIGCGRSYCWICSGRCEGRNRFVGDLFVCKHGKHGDSYGSYTRCQPRDRHWVTRASCIVCSSGMKCGSLSTTFQVDNLGMMGSCNPEF